jgi:hypothetical protein
MGVEIKLSDRELPVSPVFIDFLHHIVAEIPFEGAVWGDQLSEAMSQEQERLIGSANRNAATVLAAPSGQQAIGRAYELLVALMTGNVDPIKDIQLKFHFVNIIGVPRNGGSYLTKEIYRARGFHPDRVPNVIARRRAIALAVGAVAASQSNALPALAADSKPVKVYFGAGCFWHVQHEFTMEEMSTLKRSSSQISAVSGYAGGQRLGDGGKVCCELKAARIHGRFARPRRRPHSADCRVNTLTA